MKWFRNLSTAGKLLVGYGLLSAVMAVVGIIGVSSLSTINSNVENIHDLQLVPIEQLTEMRGLLHQIRAHSYSMLLWTDAAKLKSDIEEAQELDRQLTERIEKFVPTIFSDSVRAAFSTFEQNYKEYKAYRNERQYKPLLAGKREPAFEAATAGSIFGPSIKALNDTIAIKEGIAKAKFEESEAVYSKTKLTMLLLVLAGIGIGMGCGLAISRVIVVPLRKTVQVLEAVAAGDLSRSLDVDSKDEVGRMAAALNTAIKAMRESAERLQEQAKKEAGQAEELKTKADTMLAVVNAAARGDLTLDMPVRGEDALGQMGEGLEHFFSTLRANIATIGQNAHALATSSEELSAVSTQMSSNAEQTASQATVVSAASEEVTKNVQTVAAGIEEMSASIKEIAKNASEAARVATQAVKVAEATNNTVAKLGDSSSEIGKVIKVITSIAEQTNLLALNATIEAARAGEAGKGFAVVANEVKELAKETAKATEDIGQKIDAIQSDSVGAVEAIKQISAVINQINDFSNTIASAVEEQTATTNEIGRNVSEAARGTEEIAKNITAVAQAAGSTTEGASNSQQASSELSRMASELQQLVSQFKYERSDLQGLAATPIRSGGAPAPAETVGKSRTPRGERVRPNGKSKLSAAGRF
jgi:methyl-accepting chemotaxis protein